MLLVLVRDCSLQPVAASCPAPMALCVMNMVGSAPV